MIRGQNKVVHIDIQGNSRMGGVDSDRPNEASTLSSGEHYWTMDTFHKSRKTENIRKCAGIPIDSMADRLDDAGIPNSIKAVRLDNTDRLKDENIHMPMNNSLDNFDS